MGSWILLWTKNKMKSLTILILVGLCGCSTYTHKRQLSDGSVETVKFRSLFLVGKAGNLNAQIKDGDYSRKLSLGSWEQSGDSAMIRAIFDAGVETGKKIK